MASVLDPIGVVRGFRSGQTKTIKLVFAASLLGTHNYGVRAKTGWLRVRIICQS